MANQKLITALVGLGDFVGDAAGEALEEYLQTIITPVLQNSLLGANNEITLTSPEQLEAALSGALFSAVFNGISALTGNNSLIETVNTENIVSDKQKNTAVSEDSSDAISEISTGSPVDVNLNKTMSGIKKKLSDLFVENLLNRFNLDRRKIGDYVYVQRNVFDTLLKEGFFTDKQLRNRVDINEESGMVIETNKSSIDETFNLDNYARLGSFKKKAKLVTIREIPKAIREGHLIADNVSDTHIGRDNISFAYIEYYTEIDGKDVKIKLAIKNLLRKINFMYTVFMV